MSKAVIVRSNVNGTKDGTDSILIPRYEKGKYEYEIEFNGRGCPKKASVENMLLETFNENKVIDSINVEVNNKDKGSRLNLLICITAFDNFSHAIHKTIDEHMQKLVDNYNKKQLATN